MIRLFERNETNYNHNKNIIFPLSCFIEEEANGMFELELELPKTENIDNGSIIKAPTPRGEQLFRVYRSKRNLKTRKYFAKHIFYDLGKNFIVDVNLSNVSCFTALQSVLNNSEMSHNFVGTSNILNLNSASYIRINPIQAIIGNENSILNVWGGNLIRDNFNINIKANGLDRGYEIRMGKNLIGIEDDSDESKVITRIYPIVKLDDTTINLPEKYVDSPYINNYDKPYIATQEIKLSDEQKKLPTEDIYNIMRTYCNDLFSIYNIDKPIVNYKINFVELSKTEQYKDMAILEQLDLYDIVTCNISQLNINVKARVIKYKYDCLKERYDSIELGDFKSTNNYQMPNIVKQIEEKFKVNESAVDYATNVITGNKGGHVVTRRYPNGKPYEILIMDTEDINTATNVLRMNNSGIGFSRNGYNGQYGTAMTIDGHIVADYMDTGTLKSILLQSNNYVPNVSGTKINLADGTIDTKNFKVTSSGDITVNNISLTGGNIKSSNYVANTSGMHIDLSSGAIDSKYFKIDTTGHLTASGASISGNITGSNITGSSLESFGFDNTGFPMKTRIDNGFITTHSIKVRPMNGTSYDFSGDSAGYTLVSAGSIGIYNGSTFPFIVNGGSVGCTSLTVNGSVSCASISINGYTPITTENIGSQQVAWADSSGFATRSSSATTAQSATTADTSSRCITSYLSLSGGTMTAPNGSLWIGQNTVKANIIEQTSSEKYKKNIELYTGNALRKIANTTIKTYNYDVEADFDKKHMGVIVEESPYEIVSPNGEAIDIGAMVTMTWKAIQEIAEHLNMSDVLETDIVE